MIALVSEAPEAAESADDIDSCEMEEIVTAPSFLEMRQQLKGLQPLWLTILSSQLLKR